VRDKRSSPDRARATSLAIYMQDLAGGGVERQTLALAGELQQNAVAVTLLVNQARGELRDAVPDTIDVIDLQCSRTRSAIPRLARFLRRERPDVLLANLNHNSIAALLANILAGMPAKVVICQHSVLSPGYLRSNGWSHRLTPMAYHLLAPALTRAVAVSAGIAREFSAIAEIPQRKIVTIHNPVIGPDFAQRAAQPVAHRWLDEPGPPLFVTAGRLVEIKDHATLLRGFAQYRRNHDGRLLILGSGPLRERLGALAYDLGVADHTDFPGYQDNPLPFLRAADAFVLSSRAEGFGNVLVEAMGCGTPVISTNCPYGPAEILDHGRYGVLVPPNDSDALAAAMAGVADLRQRFPAALLQSRAGAFTTAACTEAYLHLLGSILPRPARQPTARGAPKPTSRLQSESA
jgi:glycosyltransferase involved in cell wall biosynthesis